MSTTSQLDWADCSAVERDPQRVSGAWVFRGTRIPVAALFQNLEDGVSLTEFVEIFPGVTIEQARLVLEHAARSTAVALA
ncbi:DUF433 domain-containing protein [Synechococcus sp. CB0101]|jgi:uncharacterized protein (DUF433 family)|uniref:DUF433 domain-containing protein n=1 Tax=Synechococcus sp. CB0101 TaxID=232348 RepID=UPI00020012CC|nr:DUF433 domain-containing protein [Synechococcus sp. CB0101]QCH15558.1 DUF433 domain-containing protein [Synechococcus sp. CB0101]